MFDRFTDRARAVIVLACDEARMFNHDYVGPEHILLGLVLEGERVASAATESLRISLQAARQQVEELIGRGDSDPAGNISITRPTTKVLELSLREARQLGHDYVGPEHILLSLIRKGDGVAAQVLVRLGLDLNRVRQQVIQSPPSAPATGGFFERFTGRARRVLVLAQEESRALNHTYISTEHLLVGLIREGEGAAAAALQSLGIRLDAVRGQVEEIIGRGQQSPSGHLPLTRHSMIVLRLARREALQLDHDYVGTEHILLGLIRDGESIGAQILGRLGANLNQVRQRVIELVPPGPAAQADARASSQGADPDAVS